MRARLWWPYRPFPVIRVLVAVVFAAAFSLRFDFAVGASAGPTPVKRDFHDYRKPINAAAITAVSGNVVAFDGGRDWRAGPVTGSGGQAFARSAGCEKIPLTKREILTVIL